MYKQAHTQTGNYGEARVKALLEEAGIKVEYGGPADLLIIEGMIPLEVKTANPSSYDGKSQGFQFCIDREGHTSNKGAVVILLCLTGQEEHFFIIPSHKVGSRKKLAICGDPLKYAGMWAQYLEKWELIPTA